MTHTLVSPLSNRLVSRRALGLCLAAAALAWGASAHALTVEPYSPAALAKAQAAGQGVALHFHAPWCPTCREQDKVLGTLKTDPALNKLTLMPVDYDTSMPLRKQLKVEAQSTFVVFKGKKEVIRSTGELDPARIKATLAQGL